LVRQRQIPGFACFDRRSAPYWHIWPMPAMVGRMSQDNHPRVALQVYKAQKQLCSPADPDNKHPRKIQRSIRRKIELV